MQVVIAVVAIVVVVVAVLVQNRFQNSRREYLKSVSRYTLKVIDNN